MDLIGPNEIKQKDSENELKSQAVTMIDPATGWFETHEHDDKRAITVVNTPEQQWLTRHPRPSLIACDRGNEFIGHEFQTTCKNECGIKTKPTMVRNPQDNAIVERTHQATVHMVRTFELEDTCMDEDDPWAGTLAATAFAVHSSHHATLQATPGQSVFRRDMTFNIKHVANWESIK